MNANNDEDALERIDAYLNSYIKYKYLLASHVNRSNREGLKDKVFFKF